MLSEAAPATTPRIRDALIARADAIGAVPLALVIAPAGSGKSTLLAAWRRRLAEREMVVGYLDLSPLHSDASVLAADLLEAVRLALPSFGAETAAALTHRDAAEVGQEIWRRLARTWLLDLRSATAPLVLLLDNFHELAADASGARLLDELLRARPSPLAFVIATRGSVPAAAARLRADGAVVDVHANDLSLRFDEVRAVLETHGAGDDPELVARVLARTEGWAAGVQLAARRLSQIAPTDRADFVARLGREPDLFGFVANEVLRDEPPEVLAVAEAVSLLGRCTPADVAELLDDSRAVAWVARATDRGVLLGDASEVWIHQLWRERIESVDDVARCRSAGFLLWRRHRYEGALALFARASDWASLGRLLLEAAEAWAREGRGERVRYWLAQLPEEIVQRTPAMLALHGLTWMRTVPQDSLAELERAMQMYRERGERVQERALAGTVGVMYLAHLRRDDALRILRRMITLRGVVTDPAERGALYALLAYRRFLTGRWGGALSMAQRAAEMPLDPAAMWFNVQLLAWLHGARGEPAVAREALDRGLERSAIVAHSFFHSGTLLHRALLRASSGDCAGALHDAERAEQAFREHRLPLVQEFAALAMARAHSGLGDTATARDWYAEALRRAAARGNGAEGPLRAYLAVELTRWGDGSEAPREAARAVDALTTRGDRWSAAMPWLFGFALWALARGGDARRAHELAQKRRRALATTDLPLVHHTLELALADVARAAGDEEGAQRLARNAFEYAARAGLRSVEPLVGAQITPDWAAWAIERDICADYALDRLAATAPERVLPLLGDLTRDPDATVRERGVRLLARRGGRDTFEILRALGDDQTPRIRDTARAALTVVDLRPPFQLRIRSLGGLEVRRGAEPIRAEAWKGQTARRLLVRLLVAEGRPVPREQIREDLWPDAEPDAGRNNLRVAVTRLNDALDPERPQGAPPHFVVAEGETLALRSDAIESWDVAAFRAALAASDDERQAAGSIAATRAALALYEGPFAPELGDPWVQPLRRELTLRFVAAAHALGPRLLRRGRHDEALALSDRLLREDAADERAVVLRMQAQLARGERSAALRSFTEAQAALRELGLEPCAELAALAQRVRSGA